jgi:integrase
MPQNLLRDSAIKALKPLDKTYRKSDGGNLYIFVTPTGSKRWEYRYRFNGRERTLSLGTYPDISLADARAERDKASRTVNTGRDPSAERQAEKARRKVSAANTFESVAREWLSTKAHGWTPKQHDKERDRLENHAFPWIGRMPIAEVGVAQIRPLLKRISDRGHVEQAHRLRFQLSRVFKFAMVHEKADRDPAAALAEILPARRKQNYPTITNPAEVGALLRAIDSFPGSFVVACALKLAPLWFCRPGEVRLAEWTHIDMDGEHPTYTVPATNRKLRKADKENPNTPSHIIPLSKQAVAVLRELHPLTGHGRFVFPNARKPKAPMSDGALNAALASIGYKNKIAAHGFRHMARTMLAELGFNAEALERQLSHKEPGIAGVYNKAEHLPERRRIMQAWATHLDQLRAGANVVPIGRHRASA